MDENIDDLTIEQYFKLTQENQSPSVGMKFDDMTIAEYLEYEEAVKTQDYDGYQTHSTNAGVSTINRDHLSPHHKSFDLPLKAKTNPYFQASPPPIHLEITKTPTKHTKGNEIRKEREQSDEGLGPIPGITPAQALTAIQTMADHSQKWHDGTTSRNVGSNSSSNGLDALVSKMDNLRRDMKKLKESIHAIQVGC
ncbi:hypothetical protein Tco_0446035 [Tanacetum coccineum]